MLPLKMMAPSPEKMLLMLMLMLMLAVTPIASCQDASVCGTRLEPGTPAYRTAVKLAQIYPFLDPDENPVLIRGNTICITSGDVIDELNFFFPPLIEQMMAEKDQDQASELVFYVAEQMAHRRLLVNTARAGGISVPASTVDSLAAAFRMLKVSPDQMDEYLESKGKTMDDLRDRVESEELSRHAVHVWLEGLAVAGEDEIREAYEQAEYLNLRYIFLSTEGADEALKREKADMMERIRELLKEGFSFSELEKKYSEDADPSEGGGEKKGVRRGQFPGIVDEVIFRLNDGDTSDIIETDRGLYLFRVEKHARDPRPFEEVYHAYKSQIERKKRLQEEKRILQEMLEKENLKFHDHIIRPDA